VPSNVERVFIGGEPATVYWDRAFKTFVFAG
jgi:hypothetical protein